MSWLQDKDRLQNVAQTFDRSIKLCTKDNFLNRAIAWILFVITFGQMKRETYMQRFATTFANYHCYPKEYTTGQVEALLPHESRHTKQFRALGLFIHPLVGFLPAMLVYLILPLPILLAYGRFYIEYDADRASYRYKLRYLGYTQSSILSSAARKGEVVSGASYFWCWPRPWAKKAYFNLATKVINEYFMEDQ